MFTTEYPIDTLTYTAISDILKSKTIEHQCIKAYNQSIQVHT